MTKLEGNKKWFVVIAISIIAFLVGIALDSEIIFPTALIFLYLAVIEILRESDEQNSKISYTSKAAHRTIVVFSILLAVLNIIIPIFLPMVAEPWGMAGWYDGDFVRVSINDVHEFCYGNIVMLTIYLISIFIYKKKN